MYWYRAYGLTVACSFELPELDPHEAPASSSDADTVQVHLVLDPIDPPRPGDTVVVPSPVVILRDSRVAFRITRGSVDVWEADSSLRDATRALLIGTVLAVVLYQRGSWPLHASAVGVEHGAWLFGGRSGAGKSTLAAWLHAQHGYAHLSDDAGVVNFSAGTALYHSASRAVRLSPESLPHIFDAARASLPQTQELSPIDRKVRIRLHCPIAVTPMPILGLIMLGDATAEALPRIEQLKGFTAIQSIRESLFRPWLGQYMCTASGALRFCTEFYRRVPVFAFLRHRNFDDLPNNAAPLLSLIESAKG